MGRYDGEDYAEQGICVPGKHQWQPNGMCRLCHYRPTESVPVKAPCGPECNGTWPAARGESPRAYHVRGCPNDPAPLVSVLPTSVEYRVLNEFGSVLWIGTDGAVPWIAREAGLRVEKRTVTRVESEWEPSHQPASEKGD